MTDTTPTQDVETTQDVTSLTPTLRSLVEAAVRTTDNANAYNVDSIVTWLTDKYGTDVNPASIDPAAFWGMVWWGDTRPWTDAPQGLTDFVTERTWYAEHFATLTTSTDNTAGEDIKGTQDDAPLTLAKTPEASTSE